MNTTIRDARRALVEAGTALPGGLAAARSQAFGATWLKTRSATLNGATKVVFEGHASAYERSYTMWDIFGEYDEVVGAGAGAVSLAAGPDVAFLINHRGVTMARTKAGTLVLDEDETGLHTLAYANPDRTDVSNLRHAVDDGDVTEMSFAFTIERGEWSPDWMTYRITQYNIDRGDVSAVNFGANPYTDVAARSQEIMRALEFLPAGAARAAIARLQARAERAALDAGVRDDELVAGARAAAVVSAATTPAPAAGRHGRTQLAMLIETA